MLIIVNDDLVYFESNFPPVLIGKGVAAVKNSVDWESEAKSILKGLMAREDVNFKQLEVRLAALGVVDTSENMSNKVQRGKFSLVFFLQCLAALGIDEVDTGLSRKLGRKG